MTQNSDLAALVRDEIQALNHLAKSGDGGRLAKEVRFELKNNPDMMKEVIADFNNDPNSLIHFDMENGKVTGIDFSRSDIYNKNHHGQYEGHANVADSTPPSPQSRIVSTEYAPADIRDVAKGGGGAVSWDNLPKPGLAGVRDIVQTKDGGTYFSEGNGKGVSIGPEHTWTDANGIEHSQANGAEVVYVPRLGTTTSAGMAVDVYARNLEEQQRQHQAAEDGAKQFVKQVKS